MRLATRLLSHGKANGPPAIPDFSDLNLTLYLDETWAGSPWTSLASAGSSSGRTFTEGTNPPGTATLNGYNVPDFDGTNDKLSSSYSALTLLRNNVGAGSYSGIALINLDAVGSGSPIYNYPSIISDNGGYFGIHITGTGASMYVYNGGVREDTVAFSTGSWIAIKWKYDSGGGRIYIGKNKTAFGAGVLSGYPDNDGGTMRIGYGYSEANFFNGRIATLLLTSDLWNDATFDNIVDRFNTKYGLSLT